MINYKYDIMYRADSDILTIVLTLLTFAAGIYSSVKKKRREDGDMVELEGDSDSRPDRNAIDEESPFFSLQSVFEEIERESGEFPEDNLVVDTAENAVEQLPDIVDTVDSIDSIEYSDYTPDDTAAQDVVSESDGGADKEKACNVGQSLKERIKNSPKDIVLFAEIMNPKHKEF